MREIDRRLRVKNRSQGKKTSPERGFTLAELMVVLLLSSLFLGFVYYFFINQSRMTKVIYEVGTLQSELQFASQFLESDLKRAGYMTILHPTNDSRLCVTYRKVPVNSRLCTSTPTDMRAIRFCDGAFVNPNIRSVRLGTVVTSAPNRVAADIIELMGNFTTNEEYQASINPTNPNQLFVDFNVNYRSPELDSSIKTLQDFKEKFYRPNQLLAVRSGQGKLQIVQINTALAATSAYNASTNKARILISATMPLNTSTACGVGSIVYVAPITKIRYRIVPAATNSPIWNLRREVLTPTNCRIDRVCSWKVEQYSNIAERAANLQFWFATLASNGNINRYDPRCSGTNAASCKSGRVARLDDDTVSGWPTNDDLRSIVSVFFRITVYASEEDPSFPFKPRRSLQEPFTSFELNTLLVGSARVRSVTRNVQLPNFLITN